MTNTHWLSGETKKNCYWTSTSIDLTSKLGNRDGEFDFRGDTAFDKTAAEIRVEDTTLHPFLKKAAGYQVDAFVNLALILKVVDGKFEFIPCVHYLLPYAMDP